MHVFGLWEEAGVPGETRGEHANSTQKGPACCAAAALTTVPPCHPEQSLKYFSEHISGEIGDAVTEY